MEAVTTFALIVAGVVAVTVGFTAVLLFGENRISVTKTTSNVLSAVAAAPDNARGAINEYRADGGTPTVDQFLNSGQDGFVERIDDVSTHESVIGDDEEWEDTGVFGPLFKDYPDHEPDTSGLTLVGIAMFIPVPVSVLAFGATATLMTVLVGYTAFVAAFVLGGFFIERRYPA